MPNHPELTNTARVGCAGLARLRLHPGRVVLHVLLVNVPGLGQAPSGPQLLESLEVDQVLGLASNSWSEEDETFENHSSVSYLRQKQGCCLREQSAYFPVSPTIKLN